MIRFVRALTLTAVLLSVGCSGRDWPEDVGAVCDTDNDCADRQACIEGAWLSDSGADTLGPTCLLLCTTDRDCRAGCGCEVDLGYCTAGCK